jgi:hypothetical protein
LTKKKKFFRRRRRRRFRHSQGRCPTSASALLDECRIGVV